MLDTSSVKNRGAFLGRLTSTIRNLAVNCYKSAGDSKTLDIGCGNGLFFAELQAQGDLLVGADLDIALLWEARDIFADNDTRDVQLTMANVGSLPFRD
jgi:ubiquinone/menaquinone biosynthesis C-methylase UbiE